MDNDLTVFNNGLKDCIMQPLVIAFIGFDKKQTMEYFKEFAVVNHDDIRSYSPATRKIVLDDGTVIHAIAGFGDVISRRFDQVIMAVDRRGIKHWPTKQIGLLNHVLSKVSGYRVPEDHLVLKYDLDSMEGCAGNE